MNRRFLVLFAFILVFSLSFSYAYDLEYDASGNLLSDGIFYFEYDGFDNLASIRIGSSSGPLLEDYLYDDFDNRIRKRVYVDESIDTTVYYVGSDYQQVINSSGKYNVTYFSHDGVLVGKVVNGEKFFVESDHLGGSGVVRNSSGDVVDRFEYRPFGLVDNQRVGERLYTGKELDSSGLYYYGARYYNSEIARFTQPDPVIKDVYNPQNLNRYAYVLNNPYKYTDPDGRETYQVGVSFTGVGTGIGGAYGEGIVFGFDSDGRFQLGKYDNYGFGVGPTTEGVSKTIAIDISYSGNDNIADLSGRTITIGASGASGIGFGLETSILVESFSRESILPTDISANSLNEFTSSSVGTINIIPAGIGGEAHAFDSRTNVYSIWNTDSNSLGLINKAWNYIRTGSSNSKSADDDNRRIESEEK